MDSCLKNPFLVARARAIKLIALFAIGVSYGCSAPPTGGLIEKTQAAPSREPQITSDIAVLPTKTVATASPTPIITGALISTEAVPATATPEISAAAGAEFIPVIGGADQIAFIENDEIWTANLDGHNLKRLTNDGDAKSSLNWASDGSRLYFISGQCLESVEPETLQAKKILCFEEGQRPYSFQISPDGTRAAITLNQALYVVPFNLEELSGVRSENELAELGSCASLSPYKHRQSMVSVFRTHWSADGRQLAVLRLGFEEGEATEIIHILDISRCTSPLPRLDEFPASRIEMENYRQTPVLQDFSWDGEHLFAFSDFKRNDGFGDLWIYNQQLHEGFKANPVGGKCCYRDPAFSPDGSYLAFAFQDSSLVADQKAVIYYIPYAALESSLVFPPLPLPEDLFLEPRTKPQPVPRPVQKGDQNPALQLTP